MLCAEFEYSWVTMFKNALSCCVLRMNTAGLSCSKVHYHVVCQDLIQLGYYVQKCIVMLCAENEYGWVTM